MTVDSSAVQEMANATLSECLTLTKGLVLAYIDDICTSELVDSLLGVKTHKMAIVPGGDVLPLQKPVLRALEKKHRQLYDASLATKSRIEYRQCDYLPDNDHYSSVMIISKAFIKKKTDITEGGGHMFPIDESLLVPGVNDFSIVFSGKDRHKLRAHALLGPIAFVNHSCDPNCDFRCKSGGEVCLKALRNIDMGEEITVAYSDEYFGEFNAQCVCCICSTVRDTIEDNGECADSDDISSDATPLVKQAGTNTSEGGDNIDGGKAKGSGYQVAADTNQDAVPVQDMTVKCETSTSIDNENDTESSYDENSDDASESAASTSLSGSNVTDTSYEDPGVHAPRTCENSSEGNYIDIGRKPLVTKKTNCQQPQKLGVHAPPTTSSAGVNDQDDNDYGDTDSVTSDENTENEFYVERSVINNEIMKVVPGFKNASRRETKLQLVKNAEGVVPCPWPSCGKVFNYPSHTMRHLMSHSPVTFYKCPKCTKKFRRKDGVRRHMREQHSKCVPFTCALCSKTYKHKNTLTAHVQEKHSGAIEVYECTLCTKKFKSKKNLNYHMKYHANKTDFECTECGEKFMYPWSKTRHKKEKHTKQ